MYELVQVGERTYYIDCPVRMGIYRINENEVCLIDSGNDKDAGKRILNHLTLKEWSLKMIINTHSHADHIGGNHFLQQKTQCAIYGVGIECAFIRNPELEPSFLFGGYPCKELRNKFLNAQPSMAEELRVEHLPKSLEMLRIDGHSFAMAAFKTDDEVWFLADGLNSEKTLEKYHVAYLYDVAAYMDSLHLISGLKGRCFIPSHVEPLEDIKPLVEFNLRKVEETMRFLLECCKTPQTFDDVLKAVFDKYSLTMDFNQHVLVGSTIKSYLSYLHTQGTIGVSFTDNKLIWFSA